MYNKAASLTDSKSPQTAKQDDIMCKKFTKYLLFQQATMWKLVVNFYIWRICTCKLSDKKSF